MSAARNLKSPQKAAKASGRFAEIMPAVRSSAPEAAPTAAEVDRRDGEQAAQQPQGRMLSVLDRPWVVRTSFALIGLMLFIAYLAQARTIPASSDGAGQALQAWDMLHGNVLLHGWSTGDVSYYTTEIPEYLLVEVVGGLNGDVVHVAAALTYTLLVLLAGLLAKGRATGREGMIRVFVVAVIMLAPTLGPGTHWLMTNSDHTGTNVPLLVMWLLLDRARPRWWVPVMVAVLLAWVQIADAIALFEGVLPLLVVCAVRMYRRRGPLAGQWYELSLAIGAIASAVVASLALRLIRMAGGFAVQTPSAHFATIPVMRGEFGVKVEHVLQLFGADFVGMHAGHALIPLVHLVGVALVLWAVARGVRRLYAEGDVVVQVATAAFIVLVAAFMVGPRVGAWQAAGLLPIGAVLAGRVLAGRLIHVRLIRPLAAVAACCGLLLLHNAIQPAAPSPFRPVASWLEAHHLTYGLATYWDASVVTLESGNQVQVRAAGIAHDKLVITHWESNKSWYDRHLKDALFLVAPCPGCGPQFMAGVNKTFGHPAMTYRLGNFLVLVWHHNLLNAPVISWPPPSWNILAAGSPVSLRAAR